MPGRAIAVPSPHHAEREKDDHLAHIDSSPPRPSWCRTSRAWIRWRPFSLSFLRSPPARRPRRRRRPFSAQGKYRRSDPGPTRCRASPHRIRVAKGRAPTKSLRSISEDQCRPSGNVTGTGFEPRGRCAHLSTEDGPHNLWRQLSLATSTIMVLISPLSLLSCTLTIYIPCVPPCPQVNPPTAVVVVCVAVLRLRGLATPACKSTLLDPDFRLLATHRVANMCCKLHHIVVLLVSTFKHSIVLNWNTVAGFSTPFGILRNRLG